MEFGDAQYSAGQRKRPNSASEATRRANAGCLGRANLLCFRAFDAAAQLSKNIALKRIAYMDMKVGNLPNPTRMGMGRTIYATDPRYRDKGIRERRGAGRAAIFASIAYALTPNIAGRWEVAICR